MGNSAPGQSDWFELYNNSDSQVALRGLYAGTTNALFQISSLSFVPPHGFLQLNADEKSGAAHVDFKLPAEGGSSSDHPQQKQSVGRRVLWCG